MIDRSPSPAAVPSALDVAKAALRAGALAEVEVSCERALGGGGVGVDAAPWLHLLGLVRSRQGRAEEARTLLERSVALAPGSGSFRFNLGGLLDRTGDLPAALEAFRAAAALEPGRLESRMAVGSLLRRLGRSAEAVAVYESAAGQFGDNPYVWRGLGNAHHDVGDFALAIACYDTALTRDGRFALAHQDKGLALLACRRPDEAVAAFEAALRLDPGLIAARVGLGRFLSAAGRHAEALAHLLPVHEQAGLDPEGSDAFDRSLRRVVPDWHIPMLNDRHRNAAWRAAIEECVRPGMLVLEIGTGSGLLAMIAARAGAEAVVTCEQEPLLAERARQIVAANGLNGRVEVLSCHSTVLTVGGALPRPADLLISEILSSNLVGEGVLRSLRHARQELLVPDAPMIPAAGAVVGALVDEADLADLLRLPDRVEGFDLSAFAWLAPLRLVTQRPLRMLTDDAEMFRFDFGSDIPEAGARRVAFTVRHAARSFALVQWMRMRLSPSVSYENAPGGDASHWHPVVYRFPRSGPVAAGTVVQVDAAYRGDRLFFGIGG